MKYKQKSKAYDMEAVFAYTSFAVLSTLCASLFVSLLARYF